MPDKRFEVEKDSVKSSPKGIEEVTEDIHQWRSLAKEYFNEDPDEVSKKIEALKQKVLESGLNLVRQDDKYLLKFLRAGNGSIETSMTLFRSYINFMQNNPRHFESILPSKLDKVYSAKVSTILETRDEHGRRVFINRPGKWNPNEFTFCEVFASIFTLAEMISEEAKTQIAGVTMVTDAGGFGLSQFRNYSIGDAKIMSSFIQSSFPLWFREIHLVNAPYMFMMVFNVIKPFLAQEIRDLINFHSNLESLHKFVNKDILPEELGGNAGPLDNSICVEKTKSMEPYFNDLKDTLK